jgi:hypothetical protein
MISMQISRSQRICAYGVVVVGVAALPAASVAGGSDCRDNGVVRVCVTWSLGADPVHNVDYAVTFSGSSVPTIELLTGNLGWGVYAEVISSGNLANIASLTIDPTVSSDDFAVKVARGSGAGAISVGTIDLTAPSWTGFSSILDGSFIAEITGNLVLAEDGSGAGGELELLVSSVTGSITVPKLKSLDVIQVVSGSITVTDSVTGDLRVRSNVLDTAMIRVADMASGASLSFVTDNSPGNSFAGDLTLESGIPEGASVAFVREVEADTTIDFDGGNLVGVMYLSRGGSPEIVGINQLSGLLQPNIVGSGFGGSIVAQGVTSDGLIWFEGNALSGTIEIAGDMAGNILAFGIESTALIDIGEDCTGDIRIDNDMLGEIHIGGDLGGEIRIDGSFDDPANNSTDDDIVIGGALGPAGRSDRRL